MLDQGDSFAQMNLVFVVQKPTALDARAIGKVGLSFIFQQGYRGSTCYKPVSTIDFAISLFLVVHGVLFVTFAVPVNLE